MQLAWMWFGRPAGRHPQKKKLRTELSRNVLPRSILNPRRAAQRRRSLGTIYMTRSLQGH